MSNPLVTVIIPTYNRAGMVGNAIRSALGQTYPNKEIIVVDDGSSDDTATLVRNFAGVSYVLQDHKGQAAARNNGWRQAKGTYIATLDSDDEWGKDFLAKCISKLEQEGLDLVFANWDQQRKDGSNFPFFACDPFLIPYLPAAVNSWVMLDYIQSRELFIKECPSPSSSMVIRTSSIVEGWNEKMNIADDWCMLLDMVLAKKVKVAFTTEVLWKKHINCNNIYDGRDHIEVNKLLYVADTQNILARHGHSLTREEYKLMERRYLRNLVRSAKHSLFNYADFRGSLRMMRKAIFTNPLYVTKVFSKLFVQRAKSNFKKTFS